MCWDFPGGAVVKNPPANAGDTGSSPGPGRSHMPWSGWAPVPQLLSLHSRAHEPQLLSPRATTTKAHAPGARAPQQEKPPQWDACARQRGVAPARRNLEKPARSNKDPTQPKINKLIFFKKTTHLRLHVPQKFLGIFLNKFIYFWLHWVFIVVRGLLIAATSLVAEQGL